MRLVTVLFLMLLAVPNRMPLAPLEEPPVKKAVAKVTVGAVTACYLHELGRWLTHEEMSYWYGERYADFDPKENFDPKGQKGWGY